MRVKLMTEIFELTNGKRLYLSKTDSKSMLSIDERADSWVMVLDRPLHLSAPQHTKWSEFRYLFYWFWVHIVS